MRAISRSLRPWKEVNARLLDGFTAQETQLLFSLLERAEANARRHQDATHRQDGT